MINIRPHHLLCMHGFSGSGYSDEFTKNMASIVESIKSNMDSELNIVFNTDDICDKCPHKLGKNLCDAQELIDKLDNGAIKALNLVEGKYYYTDIVNLMKNNLDKEKFDQICGECEWYVSGHCREKVLSLQ